MQDLFKKQDKLGIEFMTAECLSKAYSSGNVSQAYDNKTKNFFISDNPNQISAINENPLEVTIQFKPKQDDLIKQYLSKYDQLGFYRWDCDNIAEVTLKGTNKCTGINNLLNKCYQSQSIKVMAFGDIFNDEELLKSADVSIAMKNGTNEIKSICNYQTAYTNEEDGVGRFLARFFSLD